MNAAASTSTLVAALQPAAEPVSSHVDSSVLDYLLVELVPTLRDSAAVSGARATKIEDEMRAAGLLSHLPVASKAAKRESTSPGDPAEDALRIRLESVGAHVGANLAER